LLETQEHPGGAGFLNQAGRELRLQQLNYKDGFWKPLEGEIELDGWWDLDPTWKIIIGSLHKRRRLLSRTSSAKLFQSHNNQVPTNIYHHGHGFLLLFSYTTLPATAGRKVSHSQVA
jgi:hypothetical protein